MGKPGLLWAKSSKITKILNSFTVSDCAERGMLI